MYSKEKYFYPRSFLNEKCFNRSWIVEGEKVIASIPDGDEGEAEEEAEGASHLGDNLKLPP